jgi:4-diphosphocytidyl-2C-methyl-D-erythritol kinase
MSGSGSSLFSLYDQKAEAEAAARLVTERHQLQVLTVELAPQMPDSLAESLNE